MKLTIDNACRGVISYCTRDTHEYHDWTSAERESNDVCNREEINLCQVLQTFNRIADGASCIQSKSISLILSLSSLSHFDAASKIYQNISRNRSFFGRLIFSVVTCSFGMATEIQYTFSFQMLSTVY